MMQPYFQQNQETIYYQDDSGIMITSLRAIFGPRVFILSNITSARIAETTPPKGYPSTLMAVGLIVFGAGISLLNTNSSTAIAVFTIGILCLITSLIWFIAQKPTYSIKIGTFGGELDVKISEDPTYIQLIYDALNRAIVYRV